MKNLNKFHLSKSVGPQQLVYYKIWLSWSSVFTR